MEPPEGCPIYMTNIMTEAWNLDPSLRPNFYEVVVKLKRMSGNVSGFLAI